MSSLLSSAGAASEELTRVVHDEWAAAANRAGVDLAGFDPAAPLAERIAWPGSAGSTWLQSTPAPTVVIHSLLPIRSGNARPSPQATGCMCHPNWCQPTKAEPATAAKHA